MGESRKTFLLLSTVLKPGLTPSLLPNPGGPGQVSVVQGSLCFPSGYISFKQEKGKPGKDFHDQEDGKL